MKKESMAQVRTEYAYRENGGVGLFTLPLFSEIPGLDHGFSARFGGVSAGGMASLNLSFTRPDKRENVLENYRRLAAAAGFPYESMVMDQFEHGVHIEAVTAAQCGCGYLKDPLPPCDGLISDDPNVVLLTGHADCMALYFCDPVRKCIGLAHAGWRGAYAGMAQQMVQAMKKQFGCLAENLYGGIGPCICGDCFEVDAELGQKFREKYPHTPCVKPGKPGKAYVDLAAVAVSQMLQCGMTPDHIMTMGVCTYEDDRLFSYRRDHGDTGAMAAFIRWK